MRSTRREYIDGCYHNIYIPLNILIIDVFKLEAYLILRSSLVHYADSIMDFLTAQNKISKI